MSAPKDNFEAVTASVPNFLKQPEEEWYTDVDDILANLVRIIMVERGLGVFDWLNGIDRYYEEVVPDMSRSKKSSDKSNLRDALNKPRLSFNNFYKVLSILSCATEDDISLEFEVRVINNTNPDNTTSHVVSLPKVNKPKRRNRRKAKK